MSEYQKYQHVERLGTDETDGILIGRVYVFPKIDGTNAQLWLDSDGELCAGSRNRQLSIENDNAGFMNWAVTQKQFEEFFKEFPKLRLAGEWLVPHSLKTYRESAWRNFYVFDVIDSCGDYLTYEQYSEILEEYGIQYIPPLRIINNPTYENLLKCLDENNYLIKDGEGTGEGVVCKNYNYENKYGRKTWAKIVTSEFKEKHRKEMGAPESKGSKMIEEEIINDLATTAFIEKEFEKVKELHDGWSSKYIPELLSRCFNEFIIEESWNIVKKYKMPKVDFKTLNTLLIRKIKETLTEVF